MPMSMFRGPDFTIRYRPRRLQEWWTALLLGWCSVMPVAVFWRPDFTWWSRPRRLGCKCTTLCCRIIRWYIEYYYSHCDDNHYNYQVNPKCCWDRSAGRFLPVAVFVFFPAATMAKSVSTNFFQIPFPCFLLYNSFLLLLPHTLFFIPWITSFAIYFM